MDELICPRCKTTTYNNPSLKLMVNTCVHVLCESCVELLFAKGSGPCPECGIQLRKSSFRVQMFNDPYVEKDIDIRKKVLRDFNKREEDFPTLQEYNDYLEEIENIIYNLCHDIEIINTNKKIEQYKKENREVIVRNRMKPSRYEIELHNLIEIDKQQDEMRHMQRKMEEESKRKRVRDREELLDQFAYSDKDAFKIVCGYAEEVAKKDKEEQLQQKAMQPPKVMQFSSGIKIATTEQQGFLPIPLKEEGTLYVHEVPKAFYNGPSVPTSNEIESKGYVAHVRLETNAERAGGFKSTLACQRALQEAMQGLFHGN